MAHSGNGTIPKIKISKSGALATGGNQECSLFSLIIYPASMMPCIAKVENPDKEKSKELQMILKDIYENFDKTINILLLGTGESGKTTIIKQMKILHINGFSNEDKLNMIPFIKQNVHESIYSMVVASSRINPPVEIRNNNAKQSTEYFLNMGSSAPSDWTDEYVSHVKTLWTDPDIQTVFQRSNEYQLIDSTQHFLDKLEEICKEDYIPTLQDILFCRIMTITISKIEFSIKVSKKFGGGWANFCMYDVGGQRGHRRKWISVFDGGIQAILFIIAASDFDQTLREDENVNRLKESLRVFEEMFWSKFVREAGFIVFLNKQDLFQKKLESGKRIENYFHDYANYKQANGSGKQSEYEIAKSYLKDKLKKVADSKPNDTGARRSHAMRDLTVATILEDRDVFVHFTTATDTNNVKLVFEDVHNLILNINVGKIAGI